LFISRSIIEKHGGGILAENNNSSRTLLSIQDSKMLPSRGWIYLLTSKGQMSLYLSKLHIF